MDHTICHFEIPADDLDRAGAFYRDLFGWDIIAWGANRDIHMVKTVPTDERGAPARPGVNGMLIKRQNPHHPFSNYVHVESVDEYLKKAESLGGQVAMPRTPVPGMGYFAFVKDTEGNVIGLWEVNAAAAPAT
jgi:predicted enzyme related to lactoylglutathione lyase